MSVFRAKIWTGVGAAIVLGAGGLTACSGEGGEGGEAGAAPAAAPGAASGGEGEGGEAGSAPAPGGEGEGGEAGGGSAATGERGAQAAYAAVPAESRPALRLAQLTGFFMAAKAVGSAQGQEAAAALAGQGMLEVFDPAKAELAGAGLDQAALRKAAQSGDAASLNAALTGLEAAGKRVGGDPAAVARGLSNLTVGLYRETVAGGAVDPIEYQHSYAAALALQSLAGRQGALAGAKADIDRLVRLWPAPVAPEQGAPTLAQVQAQASRVELALSGV